MKKVKSKEPRSFFLKLFLFLYRVFRFFLMVFLYLFPSHSSKKGRHKPTLQEQMLGENIPFSDQYYIPDDQIKR